MDAGASRIHMIAKLSLQYYTRDRQYMVLVLRYWSPGRYWYWYCNSDFPGIGIGIDLLQFRSIGIGIGIARRI